MNKVLKNGTVYRSIPRKMLFKMVKDWNPNAENNSVITKQEMVNSRMYTREYDVAAAVNSLWHVFEFTFCGDFKCFSNYFKDYHVMLALDQAKKVDNIILLKSKNDVVIVPHDAAPDINFFKNLKDWQSGVRKSWWDSHNSKDMTEEI